MTAGAGSPGYQQQMGTVYAQAAHIRSSFKARLIGREKAIQALCDLGASRDQAEAIVTLWSNR